MEISCSQCNTVFTVDVGVVAEEEIEVVCPGCFYLHSVRVQVPASKRETKVEKKGPQRPQSQSLLGDGGVGERLRDGFTLHFELRHPERPEPLRHNPFVIKQLIYAGQLDGTEEFRENQGRWYPIGEHPEFERIFRLLGKTVKTRSEDANASRDRRFAGWKGVRPTLEARQPTPTEQPSEPILQRISIPAVLEPVTELPKKRPALGIGLGVAFLLLIAVVAYLFLR